MLVTKGIEKNEHISSLPGLGVGINRSDLTRFLVQMLSRCVSTKLCIRILILFFTFELRCKIT